MSPNDSFETIQEIAIKFKYDDSEMMGAWKLSPYVLVAFGLDDQADFGNSINGNTDTDEGVYLEFGATHPLHAIDREQDLPGDPELPDHRWPEPKQLL